MQNVNAKFDAHSLFYSLSHFECNVHIVYMLTQGHLPPPLTSTVKSSLFTHVRSSPLSVSSKLPYFAAYNAHLFAQVLREE